MDVNPNWQVHLVSNRVYGYTIFEEVLEKKSLLLEWGMAKLSTFSNNNISSIVYGYREAFNVFGCLENMPVGYVGWKLGF